MDYLGDLRNLIKQGLDWLEQGFKIGAAGNIVDVIYARKYHLWNEVEAAVNQELLGGGLDSFQMMVSEALYILDQRGHLNRKLRFGDCHLLA